MATLHPPLDPASFAAALLMHQERLDLTQPEMALLLSIKPRTYWQWRHAQGNPLALTMEGALARLQATRVARRK